MQGGVHTGYSRKPLLYGVERFGDIEFDERIAAAQKLIRFGISFLDDALAGILPGDLVVVSGPTGAGKTELVGEISRQAIMQDKKVLFFALEAEKGEIHQRLKYKALKNYLYENQKIKEASELNFLEWVLGHYPDEVKAVERLLVSGLQDKYQNLSVFHRNGTERFTLSELERVVDFQAKHFDLIVVDHLGYFDFDRGKTETEGVSEVIYKLRDYALNLGKPVVLVSHIKKRDKRFRSFVPDYEDIYGSSNIAKIATKIIMIAPDLDNAGSTTLIPSFIKMEKSRVFSDPCRFVAAINFDISRNNYEPHYFLGRVEKNEFVPFEKPQALPRWAKSAKVYESVLKNHSPKYSHPSLE